MKETVQNLTQATHELTAKVEVLSESLRVSDAQTKKLKVVAWVLSVVAVLCVISLVAVGFTVRENQQNAVTNCENANETRSANLALWNYVIDLSLASNQGAGEPGNAETSEETENLEAIRAWIQAIYAQRDCQDLSRKYEIPPAPPLPGE